MKKFSSKNGSYVEQNSKGNARIKVSKKDWLAIGKKAGWFKKAMGGNDEESIIESISDYLGRQDESFYGKREWSMREALGKPGAIVLRCQTASNGQGYQGNEPENCNLMVRKVDPLITLQLILTVLQENSRDMGISIKFNSQQDAGNSINVSYTEVPSDQSHDIDDDARQNAYQYDADAASEGGF